ncbi:MAG: hypothetical protein OXU51_13725 [Candidatus Poribacteria bacterium]|nr:hypothetical protein [Candidatus Poribacteria bacterium]
MTYSIYHFFANLCQKKEEFFSKKKLESFPFDEQILSCVGDGKFPDLAIKLNNDDAHFTGGELIELKDSKKGYSVASFNSTIPTGEKDIRKLTEGKTNTIRTQMEEAGNNILSLPIRQVFYLVRGRRRSNVKVCLTHGKFFETVPVSTLISESFGQALEERLEELGESLSPSLKHKLLDLFSEQQTFSRTRNVDDASVRLRFRIMTEVKAGANILNPNQYPQIGDNTLNFAVPCHNDTEQNQQYGKMKAAFGEMECEELFPQIQIFILQHHFNGKFLVFQTNLST